MHDELNPIAAIATKSPFSCRLVVAGKRWQDSQLVCRAAYFLHCSLLLTLISPCLARAASVLVVKRFREQPRRPWKIWGLDVTKQGISMICAHFVGLGTAALMSGEPARLLDRLFSPAVALSSRAHQGHFGLQLVLCGVLCGRHSWRESAASVTAAGRLRSMRRAGVGRAGHFRAERAVGQARRVRVDLWFAATLERRLQKRTA